MSSDLEGIVVLIDYLNPHTRLVILSDGEMLRIVRFIDANGYETDSLDAAVFCLAGDIDGSLRSIPFERTSIH
tara:strand:- start:291 stop:509 length:219 start_codon:yes stop_codon:yes gene_type:complete